MVSTRSSSLGKKAVAPKSAATDNPPKRGVRRKNPNQFDLPPQERIPVASSVIRPIKTPTSRQQRAAAPSPPPHDETDENDGVNLGDNFETKAQEVQRILEIDICELESYYDILNVREPGETSELAQLVKWQDEVIASLYTLGTLLHPKYTNVENASEAFERLLDAAERLGVDEWRTADIRGWDGTSALDTDVEEDDIDLDEEEDGENGLVEHAVPEPPRSVNAIYKQATPHMAKLMHTPGDKAAIESLNKLNGAIGKLAKKGSPAESRKYRIWQIKVTFFGVHFEAAQKAYRTLPEGSQEDINKAKELIGTVKSLMDKNNRIYYYPRSWTILSAEDYFACMEKGNEAKQIQLRGHGRRDEVTNLLSKMTAALEDFNPGNEELERAVLDIEQQVLAKKAELDAYILISNGAFTCVNWANDLKTAKAQLQIIQEALPEIEATANHIGDLINEGFRIMNGGELLQSSVHSESGLYRANVTNTSVKDNWKVFAVDDKTHILGWNNRGRGKQVLTARVEDSGMTIYRIEPASEVNPIIVEEMVKPESGALNLKEAQKQVSRNDRKSFVKIHWCTKSMTKLRNVAARKKDPDALCCVEFTSGNHLLWMSTIFKVLGKAQHTFECIESVCKRDGFPAPWHAEPIAIVNDPTALIKNPIERRRARENGATRTTVLELGGQSVSTDRVATQNVPASSQRQMQNSVESAGEEGLFMEESLSDQRIGHIEQDMQDLKALMKTLLLKLSTG